MCSKAHKNQVKCSGKRDRAQFVKRGEYDENTLISDYNFLQDLKRDHISTLRSGKEHETKADSKRSDAINRKAPVGPGNAGSVVLNRAQKAIVSRAKNQRHVVIRYMSPGIQRHEQNKTLWASSKSRLVWTLELSVPEVDTKPNKWIETGFHDVCKLGDLWSRLLEYTCAESANLRDGEECDQQRAKKRQKSDVVRIQLPSDDDTEHPFRSSIYKDTLDAVKKKFENTPISQTTWLIRLQDMPANKPTFCVLDPLQPLHTQLRYQTVIEFPTIYVFREVPTVWDGYKITIQRHMAKDTSEAQKDETENSIDTGGDNPEPSPVNIPASEIINKAEVTDGIE
ncbi:Box C/D snoRNA accumulation [Coemansia erecta]|nr:Box C/D snoRNA accumulation [Coemansia erecta]